jgi:hypothetical protein
MSIEAKIPTLLKGTESIHSNAVPSGNTVIDFWRWTASDILSNATRGIFAEYLVAQALSLTDKPRNEWDTFDLTTEDGIKIEVKSSGYLQSWVQKKPTSIRFIVRSTRAYDYEDGKYNKEPKHHADLYVFAVLKHMDMNSVDPLNLDQWEFYVIPTTEIEKRKQKSISLKAIQSIASAVPFEELSDAVLMHGRET